MIIGWVIGGVLAYIIQFKLHFFGANMITVKTIIGNWFICVAVLGTVIGMLINLILEDLNRKLNKIIMRSMRTNRK